MITITFKPYRETKSTLRFEEIVPGVKPKVRWLYVQKDALDEIGYQQGDNLTVQIAVDGNAETFPTKPARRRSK